MDFHQLNHLKTENTYESEWLYQEEPLQSNFQLLPPLTESFEYSWNSFFDCSFYQSQHLPSLEFKDFDDLNCDFRLWNDHFPSYYSDTIIDAQPLNAIIDHCGWCNGARIDFGGNPNELKIDVVSSSKFEERKRSRRSSKSISLDFDEIQRHFDVPITKAAKEMKVGLTALKKKCRELNIMRWPHRKIKSLTSLIDNVKELGMTREMEMLEENKRLMEKLPEIELTEKTKKLRQACFKANYKKRRSLVEA
ncbi:hypothetical protein HHK36_000057 [Tetracentron sinense]|uniref:RWP-RK domain-containing protein n=1 Tax=Tetracentron sinense TaxID=13715 RepID=A0A835A0Y4_TETSI|nr:hypothetical protein HHK36_000057 [Tetracentron sinense]